MVAGISNIGILRGYGMENEIQFLKEIIMAQNKLLICYRLGGQPSEWVFEKLAKAKKIYGDLQKIIPIEAKNKGTRERGGR